MKFQIGQSTVKWAEEHGLLTQYAPVSISTNTLAREGFAADHAPLKLYLTDDQQGGRGRNTNTWSSPPAGASLLSSWSFALKQPPQPILSPLVGLAIYSAAQSVWPELQWSLKAPNDLYLGGKKVAGLLIETQDAGTHRRVVIGLGLNVFASPAAVTTSTSLAAFDAELSEKTWWIFLTKLHASFEWALGKGIRSELADDDRAVLCEALNRHPHLSATRLGHIVSVEANGSLMTSGGLIQWSDL